MSINTLVGKFGGFVGVGIQTLQVKIWGGGGGAGEYPGYGRPGGGGACVTATFVEVAKGTTIYLQVGAGGSTGSIGNGGSGGTGYGNGGNGGNGSGTSGGIPRGGGGGGGGSSAVWWDSTLMAGAGAGAGGSGGSVEPSGSNQYGHSGATPTGSGSANGGNGGSDVLGGGGGGGGLNASRDGGSGGASGAGSGDDAVDGIGGSSYVHGSATESATYDGTVHVAGNSSDPQRQDDAGNGGPSTGTNGTAGQISVSTDGGSSWTHYTTAGSYSFVF